MTKRLTFILSLVLTVIAIGLSPKEAWAVCSGDECGCWDEVSTCFADCNAAFPQGSTELSVCRNSCWSGAIRCSRLCCGAGAMISSGVQIHSSKPRTANFFDSLQLFDLRNDGQTLRNDEQLLGSCWIAKMR
jgi:hypothetical protein